jgi:hypothetical protein
MIEKNEMLSTLEAAKYLKCSPATLYYWRKKGVGPSYLRLEHLIRYARKDLDIYIKNNKEN